MHNGDDLSDLKGHLLLVYLRFYVQKYVGHKRRLMFLAAFPGFCN